ncbi:MAG: hypothetical protein GY909_02970 [Oligoflexia bacterium]|nr:hypothetical protein [Oligoflexia bacterium]
MFGKYLLDKEIIDKSSFLRVISEQLRGTPGLLETIMTLELLSEDKLVEIIIESNKSNSSLHQLFLNELNEDQCHQVFEKINSSSPSFGQIATELGIIDNNTFFEMLSNYKSEGPLAVSEESQPQEDAGTLNIISSAALESLKEVGGISDEEYERLSAEAAAREGTNTSGESVEVKTEEVIKVEFNNFQQQVVDLTQGSYFSDLYHTLDHGEVSESFDKVYEQFRILLGAVKLAEYNLFAKYLMSWEKILTIVVEKENLLSKNLYEGLKELFQIYENAITKLTEGLKEEEIFDEGRVKTDLVDNIKLGLSTLKK